MKEATADDVTKISNMHTEVDGLITKELMELSLQPMPLDLMVAERAEKIASIKRMVRATSWNIYIMSRLEGISHEDATFIAGGVCKTTIDRIKADVRFGVHQ